MKKHLKFLTFTLRFITKSCKNFTRHDMIERSGYIAFLGLISLIPFMIFTLSLASFFNKSSFGKKSVEYIYLITPSELQELIEPVFSQFEYGKVPFLTLSTIILIYSASTLVQAARKGFQKIFSHKDEKPPNQIIFRLQSILLVFMLCIGLYSISAITLILPAIEHVIEKFLDLDIQNLNFYKQLAQFSFILVTFICILVFYTVFSPKKVPFKIHLLGAIVATSTIIPTGRLLKSCIENAANYNIIYSISR